MSIPQIFSRSKPKPANITHSIIIKYVLCPVDLTKQKFNKVLKLLFLYDNGASRLITAQ